MDARLHRGRKASAFACCFVLGLLLPAAGYTQDVDRAKAIYEAQCSICHGSAGAGDGLFALKLKVEPSDWTAGGGLIGMDDRQIFDVIAKGGVAVGKSMTMPGFPTLSESEVQGLVAHVKGLKRSLGAVPPASHASAPKPRPLESEPLRWGSGLDWGVVLTIGVSVLILVGILVSLVLYRGRQPEGNVLWLHLLSLCIFPLALLAVGNFAVLEYAKEERFCGSCHVLMQPYIDDMHNGESRSLAALHFKDRFARGTECYSCHANYGVHGTLEAKIQGLEEVYRYVTRTYELPLKMRAPYENALCLQCHAEARRFTDAFDGIHVKLSEELRTGVIRCVGCHKLAHDIPRGEQVAQLGGAR